MDSNQCNEQIHYTGEICLEELSNYQMCSRKSLVPGEGPADNDIILISSTNQIEAEATATTLLQSLPLLSPSPECEAAIKPFFCLYLFGSCDANNQSHRASQTDCQMLRDEVCAREWALAERFLAQGVLPDCDSLDNQEGDTNCQGKRGYSYLSSSQIIL